MAVFFLISGLSSEIIASPIRYGNASGSFGGPDVANPATQLIILTNFAVADGTATNSVEAHIVDSSGNPVVNQDVSFVINGGAGGVSTVAKTDANGNAVITLTSTLAGIVSITAKVAGQAIIFGSPALVTFVPGLPDPSVCTLSVVTTGATANGSSTNSVQAHITDAYGNAIPNQSVTFAISSGTGAIVGSATVTTDANGNAVITLTSTVAGSVGVTAAVGGSNITNGSPATVVFVTGPPSTSSASTALSVITTGALANGSATNSVQAHIADANGNALAGQSVTFAISSGTGAIVGSATVTTDANGNAVITLTSTVAGSVGLTATVGGSNITNGSPATVIFVLDPPSTSSPLTAISVLATGALANGNGTDSIQAHIADAGGTSLANQSVIFTIASGTGTFVGSDTVITDANGNAVISLTSTVVGSVNITATVGGNSITNGSPATVSFINPTPVVTDTLTALSVVTTGALANGVSTNSVKAHIVDGDSIPIKNQLVTFSIASGSGNFVGSATVMTDSNGNAFISLTSTIVGSVNITATAGGNAITFGSPAIVKFVNDTASVNDSATRLIVVTTNAVANGIATDSIKAHIADTDSIPVANQTVIFTITSGNGNFVGSDTVTTDANGNAVISLTSTVAGSVGITATVNGNAIIFGSPALVVFVAGPADTAVSGTALSVVTNNAAANGTATNSVKAHIADANGNAVANQQVIFTIANGTANFVGSDTVTTDSNGNATILLTSIVADTAVNITATVNGNQIIYGSPAVVIFTNKPDVTNNKTALIVLVSEAIADGQSTTSVKAHIADQSGNSLPGANVVFVIDSGSAQIITAQPVITDSNGDATILITSTKAGFVLITAQVDSQQIINGSPARVQFAAINIYVPKVFTPNGDGANDILKPILVGISSFHYFSVYNRWGNLIFTTEDPNAGWDGSFKGVPQPVETYLWIGEGIDVNGKKVVQKGMVSLVR